MARLQSHRTLFFGLCGVVFLALAGYVGLPYVFATTYRSEAAAAALLATEPAKLDIDDYNKRMLALVHVNAASTTLFADPSVVAPASSTLVQATATVSTSVSILGKRWPAPAAYPLPGALLPFNRIIAYYGNFYSKQMGVLGEYPEEQMLAMLASTTERWAKADPATPAVPAIDYIAVTAQASAGRDGKYRARMPDDQADKAVALAAKAHGIVVLDIQVGLSSVAAEVPLLEKYLAMPQVHLALDPEFDMQASGKRPGGVIGTMDAAEINWAAQYLAKLVRDNHLPPKILIVHRFTEDMVTNAALIKPLPEVQIVIDMDGFGSQAKKIGTYTYVVLAEPVQFTGFKLFYKNDNKSPATILSPEQVLSLTPAPVFIQYQ